MASGWVAGVSLLTSEWVACKRNVPILPAVLRGKQAYPSHPTLRSKLLEAKWAMSRITVQEWELLACFAVEPTLLDPDEHWFDNDAVYLVDVDGLTVSFAIQPFHKDIRLIVRRSEQVLFEIDAMNVVDVWVREETGVDLLEIKLFPSMFVLLQIRPTFQIRQGLYAF